MSKYCIFFCLLLSALTAFARQLEPAPPEQAGFAPERLEKIDAMLGSYTKDHSVAGVAAIVARNGKIVYYKASGYRNIEQKEPLQKDDLYRIASQTKAVTCVAAMMLYEEGMFLLEDPVSKYIPEFRKPEVLKSFHEADSSYTTEPANREVTIHDLLTHTSGLSYPVIGTKEARAIYSKAGIPLGFEPRPIKLADKMKTLAGLPLVHQPGEAYTYGLSIDMLGYLVEVVSGKSLCDFFRERIFEPLGMKDTYFYVPEDKQQRLATVYTYNNAWEPILRSNDPNLDHTYPLVTNGTYYSGGAGLCSTAYDFAVFLQMLANGGEYNGQRLLSPHTVRLITSNQLGNLSMYFSKNKLGFGFEIVTEAGSVQSPLPTGTFMNGGFWGSGGWVDPRSGVVAVLWTQHSSHAWVEMQNKFRVMIYSALRE